MMPVREIQTKTAKLSIQNAFLKCNTLKRPNPKVGGFFVHWQKSPFQHLASVFRDFEKTRSEMLGLKD